MSRATTPWHRAASVASECVGQSETSRNQSPFIRRLWVESEIGLWGWQERQPWCATFVSWCLAMAAHGDERLQQNHFCTASVAEALEWCQRHAQIVPFNLARCGDVVIFRPHFSHIGIVEEVKELGLQTIEGNTDGGGSREGDGVYRKFRPVGSWGSIWALPMKAIAR